MSATKAKLGAVLTIDRRIVPLFAAVLFACAGRESGPQTPTPSPGIDAPVMQPPTFVPLGADGGSKVPWHAGSAANQIRQAIFVGAWTAVRDKHFDKTLGGLDWDGLRRKYEPLALAAPDEPTFYRLLNEMLGLLGQSHLQVHGPGEEAASPPDEIPLPQTKTAASDAIREAGDDYGDPGLLIRIIEGKPTITRVRPGSSAAGAGLRPGFLVTHIGGRALASLPPSGRALRPVEERFRLRQLAARRLAGMVGSRVSLRCLDENDRPIEVMLERDPPVARAIQVLNMSPVVPEVTSRQVGDVGIVSFNVFLLQPVLAEVQKAIDGFRARGDKAIIIDLRGNPGGIGAMVIPLAARLSATPLTLGTIVYRDFPNILATTASLGIKPFTGQVIILTDEGTASTSEIFAAGLQEAKRALVVGDTTAGAALGSIIEQLPGGAVVQIPVADFKTPKGMSIEGHGVQPDRRVFETRSGFLAGHDVVLDAGLDLAKASRP
jgi:carboxyl-terminal processing protease